MVSHTDSMNFPSGGITTHCREFLCHAPNPEEVLVVGTTLDPDVQVGKWTTFPLRPQSSFLPIYRTTVARYDSRRVPFKMHVLPRLMATVPEILRRAESIYTHDVEMTLPFLIWRARNRCRVIMAIHGHSGFASLNSAHLYRFQWFKRLYWACEAWAIRRVDAIVVVSEEGYEYYKAHYPDILDKFHLIRNGVSLETFAPRDKAAARSALNLPGGSDGGRCRQNERAEGHHADP